MQQRPFLILLVQKAFIFIAQNRKMTLTVVVPLYAGFLQARVVATKVLRIRIPRYEIDTTDFLHFN